MTESTHTGISTGAPPTTRWTGNCPVTNWCLPRAVRRHAPDGRQRTRTPSRACYRQKRTGATSRGPMPNDRTDHRVSGSVGLDPPSCDRVEITFNGPMSITTVPELLRVGLPTLTSVGTVGRSVLVSGSELTGLGIIFWRSTEVGPSDTCAVGYRGSLARQYCVALAGSDCSHRSVRRTAGVSWLQTK